MDYSETCVRAKTKTIIIGIVLFLFVSAFIPSTTYAASISFSPATGSFPLDQSFTVNVMVGSSEQAMNAASGIVVFPADILRVVSLSHAGSVANFWVQEPSFSNTDGTINFEAVALNPGFTGTTGKFFSITFKPKQAGTATLSFSSASVLANDGKGTNILTTIGKASYSIANTSSAGAVSAPKTKEEISSTLPPAPVITSATHPDSEKWYAADTISFAWEMPEGVDDVSYALHTNPDFAIGAGQRRGALARASYKTEDYGDGAWYFLIRFHGAQGWGPVARRKVRVDTTPPDAPRIMQEDANADPTNPRPVLSWSSKDAKSGIANYEVRIGEGNAIIVQPEESRAYRLPIQGQGEHRVRVSAIDSAGNRGEGEIMVNVAPIATPIILAYTTTIHAPQEKLTVSGKAIPGATVHLSLVSGVSQLSFSAKADETGAWSASYGDPIMAGSWILTAHAEDNRGAVSDETKGVPVSVQAWAWNTVRKFVGWAVVALALIALGFGICYAWLVLFHHVRMARTRMQKDLLAFKKELQHDMAHLNEDIASLERSNSVNLKTGVQRKGHVAGDVRHVQEDIEKELKKISEEI